MTNEQAKAIRLTDERIDAIWNALPGLAIHNEAAKRGVDTAYALRIAFARAIVTESATAAPIAAGVVPVAYLCPDCGTHEVAITRTCHNSACKSYAEGVNIHEGWNPPSPTTALHDYTAASMELAAMIMSDCGCACFEPSTDSLAIRIATRIDAHTAAQVAASKPVAPAHPVAGAEVEEGSALTDAWISENLHSFFSYSGNRDNMMWACVEDIHFFARAVEKHLAAPASPAVATAYGGTGPMIAFGQEGIVVEMKTDAPIIPEAGAARDVLAERQRQKDVEGWTPEHDDQYQGDELFLAAACYAMASDVALLLETPNLWPWAENWWKPTTERRNLVKAGALILAEIERLDRAALKGGA